jgi:hypothetical protein
MTTGPPDVANLLEARMAIARRRDLGPVPSVYAIVAGGARSR